MRISSCSEDTGESELLEEEQGRPTGDTDASENKRNRRHRLQVRQGRTVNNFRRYLGMKERRPTGWHVLRWRRHSERTFAPKAWCAEKVTLWNNHQSGDQCLFYVAAICASQAAPLWQTVPHPLLTVEFAGDRIGLSQKLQ